MRLYLSKNRTELIQEALANNDKMCTLTAEILLSKRKELKARLALHGLTVKEFIQICAELAIDGQLDEHLEKHNEQNN